MKLENRKKTIINIAYYALVFCLILVVFKYGIHYIMPFVIGFVVALIVKPLIDLLINRLHFKRRLAAILCVALFYLVIGLLLVILSINVFSYIADLFRGLPNYFTTTLKPLLLDITTQFNTGVQLLDPDVKEVFDAAYVQVVNALGNMINNLSSWVVSGTTTIVTGAPGFLVRLLFSIVSSFFIATDYPKITRFILRQLSERAASLVLEIKHYLGEVILQYLRSYSLILGITFVELTIGFFFLRIEQTILIAFLVAVFDILPVVGTGTVLIPWAVVMFITGDIPMGIGLLVVYGVVLIVRNIIEPKIVGDNVGLHPLLTLMSMFVGAQLFGGMGLFGLPVSLAILNSLNEKGAINMFKSDTGGGQAAE